MPIECSFLVFTALDEYGDVTVLDSIGRQTSYSDYKHIVPIKLSFPPNIFVRGCPDFQINIYQKNRTSVFFVRATVSGRSSVKDSTGANMFRPLPVFEVYKFSPDDIERKEKHEFLGYMQNLEYNHYPTLSADFENLSGILKPKWYVPDRIGYDHKRNKKKKRIRKIKTVKNWGQEWKACIDELLWYMWKGTDKSGISICFTQDEFIRHDVCRYYYESYNVSIWKYQYLHFER